MQWLFFKYIKQLFIRWENLLIFLAAGLFTVISLIVRRYFGMDLLTLIEPYALYILVLTFIYANYLLFRDLQHELKAKDDRIATLEDPAPRLKVLFNDHGKPVDSLTVALKPVTPLDIARQLKAEQDALDRAYRAAQGNKLLRESAYQAQCSDYLNKYRRYLEACQQHAIIQARLRDFHFMVMNDSDTYVRDVNLRLVFPPELQLGNHKQRADWFLLREVKPDPPKRPEPYDRGFLSGLTPRIPGLTGVATPAGAPGVAQPEPVTGPGYRDDQTVSYDIVEIHQRSSEAGLKPLPVLLPDAGARTEYNIQCELRSPDLRTPIRHTLKLVVISTALIET